MAQSSQRRIKKNHTLEGLLRKELGDAPSLYRVAKEAGLNRTTLSEFVNNPDRSLRLDIADRLAQYFGIRILPAKRGRRG